MADPNQVRMKIEHIDELKAFLDREGTEYRVPKQGPVLLVVIPKRNARDGRLRDPQKIQRVKHSRRWATVQDWAVGAVMRFYKQRITKREARLKLEAVECPSQ